MVVAFADGFGAWVVDAGAWPQQRRRYFTLKDANPSFETAYPKMGLEGQVYQALTDCVQYLSDARRWTRTDGVELKIGHIAMDSGWGETANVVYRVCSECRSQAVLLPSKGRGITAAQKPMT